MNVSEETKSSALFSLASHENVFVPWMVFKTWQKMFCHHLRQEFGFCPYGRSTFVCREMGLQGSEWIKWSLCRWKELDVLLEIFSCFYLLRKKNLKGSSEPIFKGMLVIENEMGPTGLNPILFNKLLLTVSNWFWIVRWRWSEFFFIVIIAWEV